MGNLNRSFDVSAEGVFAHHFGVADSTLGISAASQNPHSGLKVLGTYEQESGTLVSAASLSKSLLLETAVIHGPWLLAGVYRDVGPEFSPLDGYTYLNDIRGPGLVGNYNGLGASGRGVKSYSIGVYGDRLVNAAGAPHEVDAGASASVTLMNRLSFGLAEAISSLESYKEGYPAYTGATSNRFNRLTLNAGYRDGTSTPLDASYSLGLFSVSCSPVMMSACHGGVPTVLPAYVQQVDLSEGFALHGGTGVAIEYTGTLERPLLTRADSQWLRTFSLTHAFGRDSQLALLFRDISGTGGFSSPGRNTAVSFQQHLGLDDYLYAEYGSPAAFTTLPRAVVKYVRHLSL